MKGGRFKKVFLIVASIGLQAVLLAAEPVAIKEVVDGDSVVIVRTNKTSVLLRLDGIDAPELSQPFGRAARGHLMAVLLDGEGEVWLESCRRENDDLIGVLTFRDEWCELSVNNRMLRDGAAWCRSNANGEFNQFQLMDMEDAKCARLGLWGEESPVEPSMWRKKHLRRINSEYSSFEEAKRDILPKEFDAQKRATHWMKHSKADECGTFRVATHGDCRLESIFRYLGSENGKALICNGLLVSVEISIRYPKKGKMPTERECDNQVRKLFENGGRLADGKRTLSLKETMRRRYEAQRLEPAYCGDEEGKLYVFLARCKNKSGDFRFGPATPENDKPSRESRKSNEKQPVEEKACQKKSSDEKH